MAGRAEGERLVEAANGRLRAAVPEPLRRVNRVRRFRRNLCRLHDVLATTPLADRYWVIGGLLLGWAREGRLLHFDARDADFAVWDEDLPLLEGCFDVLDRAGFALERTFRDNAGRVAEYSVKRQLVRFDFLAMRRDGDRVVNLGFGAIDGEDLELELAVPYQELVPFEFLGRTWRKVADHELHLDVAYGNWRVPDPGWDYMRAPNVVARRPWSPENLTTGRTGPAPRGARRPA